MNARVADLESQLGVALDRQDYQHCASLKVEIDRLREQIVVFTESRRRSVAMMEQEMVAPQTPQKSRTPVVQLSPHAKMTLESLEKELFEAQIQEDFDRCILLSAEMKERCVNISNHHFEESFQIIIVFM